jgi:hypothetical protein
MKAGSSVELKGPETRKIWPFFIYEAIIDLQESAILGAAETIAIPKNSFISISTSPAAISPHSMTRFVTTG